MNFLNIAFFKWYMIDNVLNKRLRRDSVNPSSLNIGLGIIPLHFVCQLLFILEIKMHIITCACIHAFQDKRYGLNRRLATLSITGAKTCTVCGTKIAAPERERKR